MMQGVQILRIHDVNELPQAIKGFKKSMADDGTAESTSDDNSVKSESIEKDQK